MTQSDCYIEMTNYLTAADQGDICNWKYVWTIGKSYVLTIVNLPLISEYRPPNEQDYVNCISLTEKRLVNLVQFLKHIGVQYKISSDVYIDPEFTGLLVLLCALHSSGDNMWTSPKIVRSVEEVLSAWMDWMGVSNVSELLAGSKTSVCVALRQLSDIEDWMTNPHPSVAFEWIVFNVDYRRAVSGEQNIMLAMLLRLLDDFQLKSNLRGIKCLNHLLDNMTRADFRARSLVYVDTLMRLLGNPKPQLMGSLVPCLLATIKKTRWDDNTDRAYDIHSPWSQHDEVLVTVLSLMSREEGSELSLECLRVLGSLLGADKTATLRHCKLLLEVMERTLTLRCSHPRLIQINQLALELLGMFLASTRPYEATYSEQVRFMLEKKKFDVSRQDPCNLLPRIDALLEQLAKC